MFVKEAQSATIASSLERAKVWKECHYDQNLILRAMMIPSQGGYQMTNWNDTSESYLGRNDYGTIPQGIVDSVPLQAVPPSSLHPYAPYSTYQEPIPMKELSNALVSRDPNDSLLLTLTKKMDELVVNLGKDKEKRHKPTNMCPNVWCSNCKGQDHLVTECPSPPQMTVQCIFCRGKHITINCWNLQKQQQLSNQIMTQPIQWDVNQQMQTSQPAEDKGPVQRDSPVQCVEVVNVVLTRGQQKDKNPIQDMDEPIAEEQVAPSTGLNEPISILRHLPILRLQ
uniref:Predicted protein n=1 Tax=Physcomitrium patens TaxID=3218 RepID=A9U5U9_PHYPA